MSKPYTPTTEHVRDLALRLMNADEFNAWLAKVKADAWDEGWNDRAGYDATPDVDEPEACNPYRKEN